MNKIKCALYQTSLKGYLPQSILKKLQKERPDFLILPEYFFFKPLISIMHDPEQYSSLASELKLKSISLQLPDTVIIGGSMITRKDQCFHNTCIIYLNGKEIGRYDKQRLFEREVGKICTGNESRVFESKGIRFSVLICADVLDQGIFESLKHLKPHLIFVPTFSPYKKETIEEKLKRDELIFVEGAKITGATVIKVCGVPDSKKRYSIQGRSLIANKDRVIWRTPFVMEQKEFLKISILKH